MSAGKGPNKKRKKKSEGEIIREYGRVESVENKKGAARLTVTVDRLGRKVENVMVQRLTPGFLVIPQRGWWVEVMVYGDGFKVMSKVLSGPEVSGSEEGFLESLLPGGDEKVFAIADDLEPGSFLIQLDRSTAIRASKQSEGDTYDLELHSGGDIKLRAGGEITYEQDIDTPDDDDGLTKDNHTDGNDTVLGA